jgi:hypothetical protein
MEDGEKIRLKVLHQIKEQLGFRRNSKRSGKILLLCIATLFGGVAATLIATCFLGISLTSMAWLQMRFVTEVWIHGFDFSTLYSSRRIPPPGYSSELHCHRF